ncbi:hypothetical protein K280104A7_17410 [Candidatus Bariatricus faecipullorum]
MSRKIVAIGGGENGGLRGGGTRKPYETGPMDREIVRLAEKEHPHFLFLGHAVPPEVQEGYFQTMKSVYEKLGCSCRDLPSAGKRRLPLPDTSLCTESILAGKSVSGISAG